jgi:transposase InsO family protein
MRFRFIQQHTHQFSISLMCVALSVSRSGYYAWRKRLPSARELANERLLTHIQAAFEWSRNTYGYRRIHAALVNQGVGCGRNQVARLMHLAGLQGRRRRRYKITTQSRHRLPVAPNLLSRDFLATAPNQKWVSDITYVRTEQGWLFLAAILDLYARLVVGWAIEPYLTTRLTLKALRMALSRRRPLPGLLHHSDRGGQYASADYRQLLSTQNVVVSMSRTGNVYDNAPMESFFATLKTELIHRRHYQNHREAKSDIFEYIEVFYNRQRLHSALQYLSPVDYEVLLVAP